MSKRYLDSGSPSSARLLDRNWCAASADRPYAVARTHGPPSFHGDFCMSRLQPDRFAEISGRELSSARPRGTRQMSALPSGATKRHRRVVQPPQESLLVGRIQRERDVVPPEDGAVTANPCALVHRQYHARFDLKVPLIHHLGKQSHDHGMGALTWADPIPRERENRCPTLVRRDHAR